MARREKKNNTNSKIGIAIICVIIVIMIGYAIYSMQNKNSEKGVENNTNTVEIEENIVNEELENENEVEENTVENNNITNENTVTNQVTTPTEVGVTDQKEKAIELVKEKWGKDDTVNYVFDYVNENGEYVVAVKDKASATVKNYFRVNLETKTVELD